MEGTLTPHLLPPLKFNIRADLFSQLAAMEQAGLPTNQAIALAKLPNGEQFRLREMRRWLGLGLSIPDSGLASGLFTPFEAALLEVACAAGSPASTYRRLAKHYSNRAARIKAIKSRLVLPLAVLVIAVFTNPLPKLFNGQLNPVQYLIHCMLPLMALGILAYLFLELPRHLKADSFLMRNISIEEMILRAPLFGAMSTRRNARDFFESLALLLEAGMPILQALSIAVSAMQNFRMRKVFSEIKPRIEAGASFSEAVQGLSFAGRAQAHGLILAGEVSGALPESLLRYVSLETAQINQFDDQVAEWVPRIVYTGIAVWMGYTIIRSGAFMPAIS